MYVTQRPSGRENTAKQASSAGSARLCEAVLWYAQQRSVGAAKRATQAGGPSHPFRKGNRDATDNGQSLDAERTIHVQVHDGLVDLTLAALSAEPVTIDELRVAMGRYMDPEVVDFYFAQAAARPGHAQYGRRACHY